MSDRRPENLYVPCKTCGPGCATKPTPANLLAAVRRGVESGTIKGEVADIWEIDDPCGLWVPVEKHGTYIVIGPVSDGGSET